VPFTLPSTSASLSPSALSQAQAHIAALNRLYGLRPADDGGSGGDQPTDETPDAQPVKAGPTEARSSWFKPSTWFW
jgi:hypothetical protein